MTFRVYGTPVPKGSARAFAIPGKDGARPRAVVVSDNKKPLQHWQTAIGNEARVAMATRDRNAASFKENLPALDFDGPMIVSVRFFFNRPKSVSKATRKYPTVKPDTDKLERAVLDGLTGVIWRDDAQVCDLDSKKRYLDTPGAEYADITVENLE